MKNIHKNKNIINSNVIQGDNIQVSINQNLSTSLDELPANIQDKSVFCNAMRVLIKENKIKECIDEMFKYFSDSKDNDRLNYLISLDSKFNALKMQINYGTITHEQIKTDKAQINQVLLDILSELENE